MTAKRKNARGKESWNALRERYTWHLRPPFKDEFDASHWWERQSDIKDAALYELARRHPLVGQTRLRFRDAIWHGAELRPPLTGKALDRMVSQAFKDLGHEHGALHCLCLIGLKSWPELTPDNQEFWIATAGKMKGLDCRADVEKCWSISGGAFMEVFLPRAAKLKRNATSFEDLVALAIKQWMTNPPPPEVMEAAIARCAVQAYRRGFLLIAAAPDLNADEAAALLAERWRKSQPLAKRTPNQRQRSANWLPLITEFETDAAKPKAQTFVRYRRAVDGIRFDPPQRTSL